jgi:hypothetical protein
MQYTKRYLDPVLIAFLNMLGVISFMGLLYCMVALLSGKQGIERTDAALYMVWFSISILSVYVMRLGDVWGAYALGIATLAISVYDLVWGVATLEGAMLGILMMFIIYTYIKATPRLVEQEETSAF